MENKNMNGINVNDFVNKYSKFSTTTAKESYLKTAVKFVDYINFEVVEVLCDQILAVSCYDKNGNVKVDTCKKYLMYIYTIFDQYTNIAVHADKWLEEFNALSKAGLVEEVCQLMPDYLITTLDSILKMKTDDMMTNYYEPHAFISNQILKYTPMIHSVIDKFLKGVEQISKEVDWKELIEVLKKDEGD